MVDLKNIDGEPHEVAAAAINNAEEALKNFVASLHECEHWVRNAAMTEIISAMGDAAPPEDINEAWDASSERVNLTMLKREAVDSVKWIQQLRRQVGSYEGYDE